MSAAPLRPGQEFRFAAPMRAYSYEDTHPHGIYQGALHADKPDLKVPGTFKRLVPAQERLIVQDEMFKDIYGRWSLSAWVPQVGSLIFCQLLGKEHKHYLDQQALKKFEQRGSVEVTDVTWPKPTSQALMVHVRVMSKYGANATIENYRDQRSTPVSWRECQVLEVLPLEEALPRAIEMLANRRHIPNPVAALRERGFEI